MGARLAVAVLLSAAALGGTGCGGGAGGGSTDGGAAAAVATTLAGSPSDNIKAIRTATTATTAAAQDYCLSAAGVALSQAANSARSAADGHDLTALRTAVRAALKSVQKVPAGTGCASAFLNEIVSQGKRVPGAGGMVKRLRRAQAEHRLPLHPY